MTKRAKKLVSVLLTLALILGTSSTAFADDTSDKEGTINGDSTVTNPVFNFNVPTTTDFAFNPFEVGDDGSQISSADIFVINKSSIPVQVSFTYSLTAKAGVVVETSAEDVALTGDDKEMYMVAVPAKVAAVDTDGSALTTTGGDITWSSEEAVIGLEEEETHANLTYVLDKANFTDADDDGIADADEFDSVDPNKSAAVFRFKGTINPEAEWQAEDATVKVVYKVKGVTTTAYSTFEELEDTQNVKSVTGAAAPVESVAPSMVDTTKTIGKSLTSVNYAVNLGSGAAAATAVTNVEAEYQGSYYALTDAEWDFSGTTLTLNKTGTIMAPIFITAKTYTFRVTFNDSPTPTTKTFTLVVQ